MKLFLIPNNQKHFFNFQFLNNFVLYLFFVTVSCNDHIFHSTPSTSPSENSSTPYVDVRKLLELCFADWLNPIIISPELIDRLDLKSSEDNTTSTVMIDSNLKVDEDTVFLHNSYPTYLLAGDTTDKLKSLLDGLKSSRLWSIKSKIFIVGLHGKSCLRYALEFLKFLWRNDLLSSFYLCPGSRNFTRMYTYNPFTNYAPHPWKEVEASEKPNSRWTLYSLQFTNERGACHVLEFDKTKSLDGYTIKISSFSKVTGLLEEVIYPILNLTTDRFTDANLGYLDYASFFFDSGNIDMYIFSASLNFMSVSKVHVMPVYYDFSFLIATQRRNNPEPPQIDSVIDYCTGMFMIVSLLSFITIITLSNNYQFGAAFRDVYLLLLDMDVPLPLNSFFSCGVFLITFLFAFVFSPVLEGQFFALLAKPTYHNIETLKDLYDNKYQVHFFNNIYQDIIDTGLWTTDKDMKYLHVNDPGTSINCLELARKESSTACIDLSGFILMHAPKKYGLHVSKEILFPSYYVHYARRNWVLRDRVGKKLLQSFEAGFGDYNNKKFVSNELNKMRAIESAAELEKYDLVDGSDLIPLYMFIALIFIFSVALFFLENIASRLRLPRLLMRLIFELEDRVRFVDSNRIITDEQV